MNPLPRELTPGVFWLGQCLEQLYRGRILHGYNSTYLVTGEHSSLLVEGGHPQDLPVIEEMFAAGGPEPGREIVDSPSREIAGEGIEQRVARPPRQRRLCPAISGADHEVVLAETPNQPFRISRAVLSVAVHDQHVLARGAADPALHRRSVSLVVREGCRTTTAPALPAKRVVSSLDPSSTTITSRQGAAAASARTTSAMADASLYAGITTETESGCATQSSSCREPIGLINRLEGCDGSIRSRGGS